MHRKSNIVEPSLKGSSWNDSKILILHRHKVAIERSRMFTRKPDELSRRHRNLQQKLRSKKEEFSGGMC